MSTLLLQLFNRTSKYVRSAFFLLFLCELPETGIELIIDYFTPSIELLPIWKQLPIILASLTFSFCFSIPLTFCLLSQVEHHEKLSFSDSLRQTISKIPILFPAGIVFSTFMLLGISLLIVPAILFGTIFMFVVPFILTEKKRPLLAYFALSYYLVTSTWNKFAIALMSSAVMLLVPLVCTQLQHSITNYFSVAPSTFLYILTKLTFAITISLLPSILFASVGVACFFTFKENIAHE